VTEPENKLIEKEVKLNDTTMRLVGIPFFGIAIPNLTGLSVRLRIEMACIGLAISTLLLLATIDLARQPLSFVSHAQTVYLV